MEYLGARATRSVDEEFVFVDAVSDEAAVISVEECFDVQGDDGDYVEVGNDDDLAFIDDLSFTSFESSSSQQEQLGTLRPSAGATAFAPPAPAPLRDLSNSPLTVTAVRNNDCVAGDCVDIIAGKYKGKTGTVVKRTPARVRVKLDGAEYNAKKPVDLVPHNVRRRDSSPRTGNVEEAKPSSTQTVPKSNDDFVTGEGVDIIGGTYKGKTGTVVKRTPARVQVKLDGADYSAKKAVNLVPHNVRRRVDGADDSTKKPVDLVPHTFNRRDKTRWTGSVNDAKPSSLRTESNVDFVTGDCVDIIGGTYKGKTGTVVKRTPARVQVKLDGVDYITKKPVNLVPHNVRRRVDGADDSTKNPVDLVPYTFNRRDSTRWTGSVNDAKPSSLRTESNVDFVTGDCVDIIGGTYKGKTGTVVKRTPARVQVKLGGADWSTKKPVNLVPHNVRRQDSTRGTDNVDDTKPSSPQTASMSNDDFVTGDRVDIIGGTYKDNIGTVVKRTPARVQVKLDGAAYSTKKPVNLVPHNVRHRDTTRGTSSVNDTEPAFPTSTKVLIPSDVPISSKDAERRVDDSHDSRLGQTVDSAWHGRFQSPRPLEVPQTTPSSTPPAPHASTASPAQIDTEPALPTFTKFLIPSDVITSEDTDQSVDSHLVQTVDSARHGRYQSPPLELPQATPSSTPPGSHTSAIAPAQIDTEPALPIFTKLLITSGVSISSEDVDRSVDDSNDSGLVQTVDSAQHGRFRSPRPLESPQTTPSPTPQGSHASATAPAQIKSKSSSRLVPSGEDEKGSPRIRNVFIRIKRFIKRKRSTP